MAYDPILVDKVREALMGLSQVDEKKMFQGLTFMVNDKMCVGVREDELMFRIDPVHDEQVLERTGCRAMVHGKRIMKGFIFVGPEGYRHRKDFDFLMNLALEYNKIARSSKQQKK